MVYCVKNAVTGLMYVGSTINSRGFERWDQHKKHLRTGVHHNPGMQADYNAHGMKSFCFSILEKCEDSVRYELEQKHMDSYPFNQLYNRGRFAKGGARAPGWKMPASTKRKIGDANRGNTSHNKGKKVPDHGAKCKAGRYANRTIDIEVTMDSGEVLLFVSQTEAAKALGCGRKVVGNILDGKVKSKHSTKYKFTAQRVPRR